MFDKLNNAIASSFIGRYFKLENSGVPNARNTRFTTELRAGLATFVTMAYIISVNAIILVDSDLCVNDSDYLACQAIVKQDLITATAAVSCIATAIMGLFANLPLALAPGMGMNAYFTYTVVGFHGSGKIAYETAIAAVFVEGLLFVFLSVFGLRQLLARLIPMSIKIATGAGVGFFITFIGLQRSAGIALISHDPSTIVTLGGCPDQYYNKTTGICTGHNMESPTTWLGIFDETGDFEGSTAAFICDASSISIGAIFGTSPVTTYIESGSGITEGGRTGITSLVVAFFFFISLFFAPIFASIPPWASGPALVIIGSMMAKGIKDINWKYIGDAVPKKISFGRISHDKSDKEPWGDFMIGPGGEGLLPMWIVPVVYKIRGVERTAEIKESVEIKETKEISNMNRDIAVD
ncbi:18634_t:CDS:2, partial [Racocetra fulgida]